MPDNFLASIGVLLDHEGPGYVPDDNGRGPSKWGITWLTAQVWGLCRSPDEIQRLTRNDALTAYRYYVWNPEQLWRINDPILATKVFDLSVNMGGHTAIKLLQHAINIRSGPPSALKVDGVLGPRTAEALNAFDPAVLLAEFKIEAKAHYEGIVHSDPAKYAKDLAGWLTRLDS